MPTQQNCVMLLSVGCRKLNSCLKELNKYFKAALGSNPGPASHGGPFCRARHRKRNQKIGTEPGENV